MRVLIRPKAGGTLSTRPAELEVVLRRQKNASSWRIGGEDSLSEASFDSSCASDVSSYDIGPGITRGLGIT